MNKWLLMLFVSVVAWFQIYFLSALTGGYAALNLVVILVAAIAVRRSLRVALTAAVVSGFWLESASVTNFGIRMGFLVLLVLGIYICRRSGFLIEQRGFFALICALGALLYSLWLLIWTWFDVGEISWPLQLSVVLVVEMVAVLGVAYVVFKQVNKLVVGQRYG